MNSNTQSPLVSVALPVYNAGRFLKQTMDSIVGQSYRNLQIVVVDDGSTDHSMEIVRSYQDPRIEIFSMPENSHVCAARNECFLHVHGKYTAIMDSDDVWALDKIEKQVALMEQHPELGVCFTWCNTIDENSVYCNEENAWFFDTFRQPNRTQGDWLLHLLENGNCLSNPSALLRTEVLQAVGKTNLSLVQLQDYDFWIRVLSKYQIHVLPEFLTDYRRIRVENGSISADNPANRSRTTNEEIFVCTHFFDHISDDLFAELFRNYFRNKNASTAEELACERAFLLERAYCRPEPMMNRLQALLSEEKTAAVLRDIYGYTPKDFYAANIRPRFFDRGMEYRINDMHDEFKKETAALVREKESLERDKVTLERDKELLVRDKTILQEEIDGLWKRNGALERELSALSSVRCDLEAEKERLGGELLCAQGEVQQLRDKENRYLNDIAAIRNSRSWRFAQFFARILRFFIPIGSKRALFCRLLWTLVRHPGVFFRNLTPRKIKKTLRMLRRGDTQGVQLLVQGKVTGEPAPSSIVTEVPKIVEVEVGEKTIDDYPVLQVPQWDEPTVSIVIPVYNQFEFTYHCVESILKNSGDVTYEILIANDCSSDLTTEIDKILPGVKCITNEKNLRFLLNCNNAAKYATGKYVLFLNNDTQVQENWLQPLVTLIESSDDIGLVGSKLIYPDGRLQEAGGILWRDGSAWNFGNRQNPALPQFNYVKQVDYISGAAIMLSRALWEEIGGFDEHFVPAYCEDSDLCFTVRKMGYRVMYQPLSVVVHFEGVSNGTDTSAGQKKYQIDNSEKFRIKWAEELAKHPENGENVFQARDYSFGKKTLLMVDHYVPHFDKDAGSRTVFQYLKLFVDQGFNVKFIGDNFYQHEPYTTALQQMGIEVLYGPEYANHWRDWVRENAEHIDYVFLNRPHIAPKYLDFLRVYTRAKIMYYGHDLAFLREMREYEITGDASFLDSSKEWQPKELALMRSADMAYYPSYVEVDEIAKLDPHIRVKAIPAYLFEGVEWDGYDFEARKDIMFIGGFGHRPNVDAVKWLASDVLPILKQEIPDIRIHILGSNPPKEVLSLANENLIMEGFVTDEQLDAFYRTTRISLVPLRYGAGIKGKVIEAMRYGTPVITTPTGAEGIPDAESIMAVEESAEALAKRIAALYRDAETLAEMSRKSVAYVQKNYSQKNAIAVIGPEFDMAE